VLQPVPHDTQTCLSTVVYSCCWLRCSNVDRAVGRRTFTQHTNSACAHHSRAAYSSDRMRESLMFHGGGGDKLQSGSSVHVRWSSCYVDVQHALRCGAQPHTSTSSFARCVIACSRVVAMVHSKHGVDCSLSTVLSSRGRCVAELRWSVQVAHAQRFALWLCIGLQRRTIAVQPQRSNFCHWLFLCEAL
jgi:hypothetical protein